MSFKLTINGSTHLFDKKVELLSLTNGDKDIICATVNGRVRELNYDVYYDADIRFLKVNDHDAMGIYERGIRFIFAMATHNLYPGLRFRLTYSVSRTIYAQIDSKDSTKFLTEDMVNNIEKEMHRIVEADYQFKRLIKSNEEAEEIYKKFGLYDKLEILPYRKEKTVHFYDCNGYFNYMYGKMVPSTGYLKKFNLIFYTPGLVIQYPRSEVAGEIPEFKDEPVFSDSLIRAQEWSNLVDLSTVSHINKRIKENELSAVELINLCEDRHNRMLCELGQQIENNIKKIRLICIAGPSSSGKTTFADRLTVELKSRGINPVRISMDDYYKRREDVPKDEDGNYDFECTEALDIKLFNQNLVALLNGLEVNLPSFDFKTNDRIFNRKLKIGPNDPIIIEGIHALNEQVTSSIPKYLKFKIYISPQAQINLDNENPLSLTDIRLLRRIVRIYHTQEDANYVFDSFLNYELCVLKKHALPLLQAIDKEGEYGPDAERLINLLKYFKDIDEKRIPSNSLLKEFIGGSCYRDAK